MVHRRRAAPPHHPPHHPERLGPDDWTAAALGAIAEQGVAHVSVERLARDLGATKGSFYWHFKDRPALIAAALARWEHDEIDVMIERLTQIADPRQRLRHLLASAFEPRPRARVASSPIDNPIASNPIASNPAADLIASHPTFGTPNAGNPIASNPAAGPIASNRIASNLLASADDPAVAEVLARVASKRLACLERIFRQAKASAPADRALLALSAHAGMTQLGRASVSLTSRRTTTYLDHAVARLLAPDPP